jgi:Right handed beta helix region/FlgD Ig-like domain
LIKFKPFMYPIKLSIVLAVALLCHVQAFAKTIHVPEDYSRVIDAMYFAVSGDSVLVAPGHYKTVNLLMRPGIVLAGTGNYPEDTVLDAEGAGRIIRVESLKDASVVTNLTFSNGLAQGEFSFDKSGGAIYCSSSELHIINCRFLNNAADGAGGAIRYSRSSPKISGCWFENNTSGNSGGAIDCSYESSPTIDDSYFVDNKASLGGAISCRGESSPEITGAFFDSNIAEGSLAYGGAIFTDYKAAPDLTRCTFKDNEARHGGGIASFRESPVDLDSCTLVGNVSTGYGGGMICQDSSPLVTNSIIAFQQGTSISCYGSTHLEINNTDMYGNSAGDWHGDLGSLVGLDGNIAMDPLFCELKAVPSQGLVLESGSPCAESALTGEHIGAWPAGCKSAQAMLSDFLVDWLNGRPQLQWRLNMGGEPVDIVITRAAASAPDVELEILSTRQPDGEANLVDWALDDQIEEAHTYRIYQRYPSSDRVLLGETVLEIPARADWQLLGIWPNPFNPMTGVHFELGSAQHVRIDVYSVQGKHVRTLANQVFPAGPRTVSWNGRDLNNRSVSSGTYFLRIAAPDYARTHKVMLVR